MAYKVKVTIESVTKGECRQGFKAGDSWVIEDSKTPGGMCASAYNAVAPQPWDSNKDVTRVACPDPEHRLIYQVSRLRE